MRRELFPVCIKRLFCCLVFLIVLSFYNTTPACSYAAKPLISFDPEEFIFKGRVMGYIGPIRSDSLKRSFSGIVVQVEEVIYMPVETGKFIEIIPYWIGAACELTTTDLSSLEKRYPVGSLLRIVGTQTKFLNNNLSQGMLRLDINPFKQFNLSIDYPGIPETYSEPNSSYNYKKINADSLYDFLPPSGTTPDIENYRLSIQNRSDFELRKDLYRLYSFKDDSTKAGIIKRIANHERYYTEEGIALTAAYISDNKIKEELVNSFKKRFMLPPPDYSLHSELPEELKSAWEQTPGPYGGPVTSLVDRPFNKTESILISSPLTKGIYISTNNGTHWVRVDSQHASYRVFQFFVIDDFVFAGTDTGIIRSSGNCKEWSVVNNGISFEKALQVKGFTSGKNYIFAASGGKGIFRSVDNGDTWESANTGLTNLYVNSVIEIDGNIIAGTHAGIFISYDDGNNWNPSDSGLPASSFPAGSKLYIGSLFRAGNIIFAGTERQGIYFSVNKGELWNLFKGNNRHSDLFAATGISNNMFLAADNYLYRSTDSGNDWVRLPDPPTQIYDLHINNEKQTLYLTGSAGIFVSADNGLTWKNINAGIINTRIGHLVNYKNNLIASSSEVGVFSFDKDAGWTNTSGVISGKMIMNLISNNDYIFAKCLDTIYRSSDMGRNWEPILSDSKANEFFVNDIGIFAKIKQGIIFSSDNGDTWVDLSLAKSESLFGIHKDYYFTEKLGVVYRSSLNGEWQVPLNTGLEPHSLSSLYSVNDTLYGSTSSKGIMRSYDNGYTWLFNENDVQRFRLKMAASFGKYLFAVSQPLGIFISINGGKDWIPFNYGFKDLHINSLVVVDDILYAGTSGGVWAHRLKQ